MVIYHLLDSGEDIYILRWRWGIRMKCINIGGIQMKCINIGVYVKADAPCILFVIIFKIQVTMEIPPVRRSQTCAQE